MAEFITSAQMSTILNRVKNGIDGAVNIPIETSQPNGGMLPNVMYDLGTISADTTFSFAEPTNNNIVNHYFFKFYINNTLPEITWPDDITMWVGGSEPTITARSTYIVSVIDGIAVCNKAFTITI